MAVEIERKFLVVGEGWREHVNASREIEDYLIASFEGGKARVRLCDGDPVLTIKGPRKGSSRSEYHLPLSPSDANAMIADFANGPGLRKIRHDVIFGGLTWQIDEFRSPIDGLFTADVELPDESHPVEMPDWAGLEITGDSRFSSSVLASATEQLGQVLLDVRRAIATVAALKSI